MFRKMETNGILYFNPRSHKGSDWLLPITVSYTNISIHAPTRGATSIKFLVLWCRSISIHAPTRGATGCIWRQTGGRSYFNPRSHKGSDERRLWCLKKCVIFQSTLPQGERHQKAINRIFRTRFQSTLPQGERQQFYTKFHICFISFLPILSPYHISTHSPLPTFNHFLYIFSGANRPEISCLLPFRTKTISGIL